MHHLMLTGSCSDIFDQHYCKNNKHTMPLVDLKWFEEMSCSDWEVFAENLKYSPADTSTTHLNCHGDRAGDWYSSFRQMEAPSAQEYLTQLEIALRPLKEDLSFARVSHTPSTWRNWRTTVWGFEANCQKHYLIKKSAGNCLGMWRRPFHPLSG
jgi:hypothetical protein